MPTRVCGIVQVLIQHNANVSQQDSEGNTPLHIACQARPLEVFRVLLQHNPDIYLHNSKRESVIHVACQHGRIEAVKMLLQLPRQIS
jgi:ankyrin repeat protein